MIVWCWVEWFLFKVIIMYPNGQNAVRSLDRAIGVNSEAVWMKYVFVCVDNGGWDGIVMKGCRE